MLPNFIMSEKETEKSSITSIIKLDEHQFRHLLTSFGSISREVGVVAERLKKLEDRLTAIEGELKLIRMEIGR